MARDILDLNNIIDSYDTLKVGDKTYKVGSISTEAILKMEKIMRDIEFEKMEIDEKEKQLSLIEDVKEKKKFMKEIVDMKSELQLKQVNAIPEQIHMILSEFNTIELEEVKSWGINAQLKFMEWFNKPFLGLTKPQEDTPEKTTQE